MHRKDCDSLTCPSGSSRGQLSLVGIATLAVGLLTQPSLGAAVRMWPDTVVADEVIRVSDVAQVLSVVPDQAVRFGDVAIKPAPKPGERTEVTLDELREALVRAGANPVEFTVRGSVRCRVVRPLTLRVTDAEDNGSARSRWWWPNSQSAEAARSDGSRGGDASQAAWVPETTPGQITVAVPQSKKAPQTLERVLHEFVSQRLAHLGGQVHLRFSPNVRQALSLSKPEYDFRIHWRSERRLGSCSLEADVLQGGQIKQTLPMVVEVSMTVPVVVATRPISRGQVIRSQDVVLDDRDFVRADELGLTEVASAAGQQSRRFIRKGEMVRVRDVKPCPLVERGDLVTALSDVGGLRVRTVVKALESGMLDQTIEVRNEASRERFRATVVGPQMVKVAGAGRRVSMAVSQRGGHR